MYSTVSKFTSVIQMENCVRFQTVKMNTALMLVRRTSRKMQTKTEINLFRDEKQIIFIH